MWETKGGMVVERLIGGRSNVFLLDNSDASILVDTSWQAARSRLSTILERLEYATHRSLTALFLTHTHFDHAGNAAWIQARYRPQLILQQNEVGFLCNGDNTMPAGTNTLTRLLLPRFGKILQSLVRYTPACPDISFDDCLDLTYLGFDAYLLHTPGHSTGSSSLIVEGEIALVGDAMYGMFPNSAYPPFADDPQLLIKTWEKLLDTRCELFLPSHGKAIQRKILEQDFLKRREQKLQTSTSLD
jgi:glyoxylase-like metal-dependent hydrolase (beta-lactamase superfamily II)